MNPEKAKCTACENINEVKVSTGHNKPENKGRKYFTCANCNKFQWVDTAPIATAVTKDPEQSYMDKRSARIERQHSQDMAIKFLELVSKIHPEEFMEIKKPIKDIVKDYADYFQADLDSSSQPEEVK